MSTEQQQQLLETVCYAVREAEEDLHMKFEFFNLAEMDDCTRRALVERLAIPPMMFVKKHQTGLLLSEDESVSILVNGKEHICIQVSQAGAHIQETVQLADRVDDSLNQHIPYAFSKKYGYLTASPLYTGTGMSASYLMHLPYLEKQKMIGQLEKMFGQYGFSLREHFHGQVQAPGSIYRVKNRKTLGLSESEIISALEHLTGQLVTQEQKIADRVMHDERSEEEDRMYRAYGLLKYARDLEYDETLEFLSIVRSGDLKGVWHTTEPVGRFSMMLDVQKAVLESDRTWKAKELEKGRARAAYIRQNLVDIDSE
jgi:protein arginine kinase